MTLASARNPNVVTTALGQKVISVNVTHGLNGGWNFGFPSPDCGANNAESSIQKETKNGT